MSSFDRLPEPTFIKDQQLRSYIHELLRALRNNFATAGARGAVAAGDGVTDTDVIDDQVATLLQAGSGISLNYTGAGNELTITNIAAGSDSFESVNQNLAGLDGALSYTGDELTSITYDTGGGTIVKTLNYSGGDLISIVLSGDTPSGIELTKTLNYSGDDLVGVSYS